MDATGAIQRPGATFVNPYGNQPKPQPNTFLQPATVVGMSKDAQPPYAQNWNLSLQRSLGKNYVLEGRYVGPKGTRLPRNIEANPAVWGPGATAQNADRRRIYAELPGGRIGVPAWPRGAALQHHQLHLSCGAAFAIAAFQRWRRVQHVVLVLEDAGLSVGDEPHGRGGAASLPVRWILRRIRSTWPRSTDRRCSMHAPLRAQWKLGDSGRQNSSGAARLLLAGWQLNAIATASSGTPFTVFDSANVAGQASHPPISGFAGSRPDVVSDPNAGPHTVEQWISRSAFRRLNPVTEAGNFGNAGRNIARPMASSAWICPLEELRASRHTACAVPSRVLQPGESRQFRLAGNGSGLARASAAFWKRRRRA